MSKIVFQVKEVTQTDKLQALIQKAIDGGFDNYYEWAVHNGHLCNQDHDHVSPLALVFDHDFAKALFGEKPLEGATFPGSNVTSPAKAIAWYKTNKQYGYPRAYQYHLQQAVINNDPISYMYEVVFTRTASRG